MRRSVVTMTVALALALAPAAAFAQTPPAGQPASAGPASGRGRSSREEGAAHFIDRTPPARSCS